VALEKPDWLALLAPLPRDVKPERKPVASAEQIEDGTAGPIADWVSLSVNLSAPHGSRNVLVTLDGDGHVLSAGDHVMFVSQAARLDRPIAIYDHHSVGGRYAPDGSFHGTRWLTRNELEDGTDDPVATASTPSQPSDADVAALRALVADIVMRAS
jgi:hypothetical protein